MRQLDGKLAAQAVYEDLKTRISKLADLGIRPTLVILKVGNDPRTTSYIKAKERAAAKIGVELEVVSFDEADPNLNQLVDAEVATLNHDPKVHGIILQLPAPGLTDEQEVIDKIDPRKDVDGLSTTNQAALEMGRELITPATPSGILRLLAFYGIKIAGKKIGLIGRGRLVGAALEKMLVSRGAIVKVATRATADLSSVTKNADIVISAAGSPGLVTDKMINSDAILIDVGLSEVDSNQVGDTTIAAKQKAAQSTPVPGGVGPMTVASLLANVVLAAELTLIAN